MTFVWRGCTIFCVERLHDLTHSLTQVRLHDFLCAGFVFFLWRGCMILLWRGCMLFCGEVSVFFLVEVA